MRRLILLVPLLLVAGVSLLGARGCHYMRASACKVDITPVAGVNHSDPIYMAGFGNNRLATGVHDPIWARGLAIKTPHEKIAIVTLDLVGYFFNEIETIRGLVSHLGFDYVIVTSTHNHEGPDTMGLWGPNSFQTGTDLGYLDFVNESVADCLEQADAALVPAEMRLATGDTRDTSLPPDTDLVDDGRILEAFLGPDAIVLGDGTVIEVQGDDGKVTNPTTPTLQLREIGAPATEVIATLVNYASHPEALSSRNTLLTSDFPHFMRENLEARYGGVAIYASADLGVLQGPLGIDLADPSTGLPIEDDTFEFAELMGNILADRVAEALDPVTTWNRAPNIRFEAQRIQAQLENPFFRAAAITGILGRRQIIQQVPDDPDSFVGESEAGVLQIGKAQFVVTPNEVDPQIGDLYREAMTGAEHRFVLGLANDEIGYQMEAEKFDPSCFECATFVTFGNPDDCPISKPPDCDTIFQNNVGPGADPLIRSAILEMLAGLNE